MNQHETVAFKSIIVEVKHLFERFKDRLEQAEERVSTFDKTE